MTIVGVAAPAFRGIDVGECRRCGFPRRCPRTRFRDSTACSIRRTRWMQVLGRVKADVTAAQAQAALQTWFNAMLAEDMGRPGFRGSRRSAGSVSRVAARGDAGAARPFHLRGGFRGRSWVLFAPRRALLGSRA
jgi:hypothetical protein